MRIIFVENHIVDLDSDMTIIVSAGRKGTLLDRENGIIELDSLPLGLDRGIHAEPIYGFVEGVQPSKYIRLRTDLL